jgi:hypothetical protein
MVQRIRKKNFAPKKLFQIGLKKITIFFLLFWLPFNFANMGARELNGSE